MNVKVIIGANYGDEGKGLMTDYFSAASHEKKESCIVVCTNGGSQRGHTVVTPDNQKHVFSHFGSGTFENTATSLPKYYVVNPMDFWVEYKELKKYGLNPQTFYDNECLWSTPYDMIANQAIEEYRGDKRHGSCEVGIWETILRSQQMRNPDIYEFYAMPYKNKIDFLFEIKEYYKKRIKEVTAREISNEWHDVFESIACVIPPSYLLH